MTNCVCNAVFCRGFRVGGDGVWKSKQREVGSRRDCKCRGLWQQLTARRRSSVSDSAVDWWTSERVTALSWMNAIMLRVSDPWVTSFEQCILKHSLWRYFFFLKISCMQLFYAVLNINKWKKITVIIVSNSTKRRLRGGKSSRRPKGGIIEWAI